MSELAPLLLDDADVARWIGQPVPEMRFAVAELIPDECCALLVGDGGSGKSILLQMMATCVAMGLSFCGRAVTRGKALYVTAEDTEAVVHARQERINRALGITMEDLAGHLFVLSMADKDFTIFSNGDPTAMESRLALSLVTYGVRFVGIDNASLVFDDMEIDRRAVSAFLARLNRMARAAHCAIVLIAHTSRSSDGTSARLSSGSTGWTNTARAGLFLKRVDDGAELSLPKPNYARQGIKIDLRWTDDGVLVAKEQASGIVASIEQRRHDEIVLAEVKARSESLLDPLSKSPRTGERYLPAYIARLGRLNQKQAAAAMVRLLDAGKIVTSPRTRQRPEGLKPAEVA